MSPVCWKIFMSPTKLEQTLQASWGLLMDKVAPQQLGGRRRAGLAAVPGSEAASQRGSREREARSLTPALGQQGRGLLLVGTDGEGQEGRAGTGGRGSAV